MTGHHPECDRAQELRLARPGRPDAKAVRPHTFFGGFLDIELEWYAGWCRADWNTKPIAATSAVPKISRGVRHKIANPEEIEPAQADAGCGRGRIRPSPVPGQSLRTRERSGITHLIRLCVRFVVARR